MTTDNQSSLTSRRNIPRASSAALTVMYFAVAAVGLVGTWYFNIRYIGAGDGANYLADWFANTASSSAATDVIVTALVAIVFYVVEGRRIGWNWWVLVLVPLTFAVALAFTFPLFLALREITVSRREGNDR